MNKHLPPHVCTTCMHCSECHICYDLCEKSIGKSFIQTNIVKTLRDEFAIAALAFLHDEQPAGVKWENYKSMIAKAAYQLADEMLEVREQK